jgi:hypothetical protein
MTNAEIVPLSESEIEQARKHSAAAHAGISALHKIMAKNLGFDATSPFVTKIMKGLQAEKTIISTPDGFCLGVYEDPPGICRYCGPAEE